MAATLREFGDVWRLETPTQPLKSPWANPKPNESPASSSLRLGGDPLLQEPDCLETAVQDTMESWASQNTDGDIEPSKRCECLGPCSFSWHKQLQVVKTKNSHKHNVLTKYVHDMFNT